MDEVLWVDRIGRYEGLFTEQLTDQDIDADACRQWRPQSFDLVGSITVVSCAATVPSAVAGQESEQQMLGVRQQTEVATTSEKSNDTLKMSCEENSRSGTVDELLSQVFVAYQKRGRVEKC